MEETWAGIMLGQSHRDVCGRSPDSVPAGQGRGCVVPAARHHGKDETLGRRGENTPFDSIVCATCRAVVQGCQLFLKRCLPCGVARTMFIGHAWIPSQTRDTHPGNRAADGGDVRLRAPSSRKATIDGLIETLDADRTFRDFRNAFATAALLADRRCSERHSVWQSQHWCRHGFVFTQPGPRADGSDRQGEPRPYRRRRIINSGCRAPSSVLEV